MSSELEITMKKKFFERETKQQIYTKAQALERESNITLISTAVAIISFFLLIPLVLDLLKLREHRSKLKRF